MGLLRVEEDMETACLCFSTVVEGVNRYRTPMSVKRSPISHASLPLLGHI